MTLNLTNFTKNFFTAVSVCFCTTSIASSHHNQPWIFGAEPVPAIKKRGTLNSENALFFVTDRTCEIDVVLWLRAPNAVDFEGPLDQFADLDFNIIVEDEYINLAEEIYVNSFLASDAEETEWSSKVALLFIGNMDDSSPLIDWISLGMTGFKVLAKNDKTFRYETEYWDVQGLQQAIEDMDIWCRENNPYKKDT